MSRLNIPYDGSVEVDTLADVLTRRKKTEVDNKPAHAREYIFLGHTLKNHLRILTPIRHTETVSLKKKNAHLAPPKQRVMAVLWYGATYSHGMVLELYGYDQHKYGMSLVNYLMEQFGDDAGLPPIGLRDMNMEVYE